MRSDAAGTTIESASVGKMRAACSRDAQAGRHGLGRAAAGEAAHRRTSRRRRSENCVAGRVWDIGYLGDLSIYKVRLDNGFVMKAAVANATRLVERPIGWDDDRLAHAGRRDAGVVLTR